MKKKRLVRSEVGKTKGYRLEIPSHRIKLNQNESPYDLPAPLKEKVIGRMREISWNRYPSPHGDSLRNKIGQREGWDPNGVLVAPGSNVLIQAVSLAAAVGQTVLTVEPSFSLYEIEGALLGNRVVKVPLVPADFSLPLQPFLKRMAAARPAVVFLANPNAPTGTLFDEGSLLKVIEKAPGLVLVDEAYHQFAGRSLLPFLKKNRNLLLLRTFSKAFSLGGVRLGYLLGSPRLVAEIRKVTLPFSVGSLAQAVGEAVLDEPSYVEGRVQEIVRERQILFEALRKIEGLRVYPSWTNFILFQTGQAKRLFRGLVDRGILIRDVSGKHLRNALRVTVGSPQENREFLQGVRECLPTVETA